MSGCMYPITKDNTHIVRVNALQYLSIIGSEKARILVNENEVFAIGDKVLIIETSIESQKPTGNTLTRFVLYTEQRVPLHSDDDYLAIHLVPMRSMINQCAK